MTTYFVSDLHLTPDRPEIGAAFTQFLFTSAPHADAIYVLGDLFEYWIGDDAAGLLGADPILEAMQQTAAQTPCYFIAGNRDFLVRDGFSQQSGFKVLEDHSVIDLYGQATLLLHGDSLCTDDHAHQAFRHDMVTNTAWCTGFLSQPIETRIEMAKAARKESRAHKQSISMSIMDVNEQAVLDAFATHDVDLMIHGHTHRQNTHTYTDKQDKPLTRIVLGDWDQTNSVLKISADGRQFENTPLA